MNIDYVLAIHNILHICQITQMNIQIFNLVVNNFPMPISIEILYHIFARLLLGI